MVTQYQTRIPWQEDDMSLLSHQFQHIQQKTIALQGTAKPTGLATDVSKKKLLGLNLPINLPIILDNHSVEDPSNFTYLGSMVKKGDVDKDTKTIIW